jgi:hypothetical protein
LATCFRALFATIALFGGGLSAAPAHADIPTPVYQEDTGWVPYDGGCKARTQFIYYSQTNRITMKTDVYDPYWFAECKVNAKAILDTRRGAVEDGPTQQMYACKVVDASCASTRYGPWESYSASPFIDNLKAEMKDAGVDLDLGKYITGIRIQHTKQ